MILVQIENILILYEIKKTCFFSFDIINKAKKTLRFVLCRACISLANVNILDSWIIKK